MFRKIARLFKYLKLKIKNDNDDDVEKGELIPNSFAMLEDKLKEIFADCNDFVVREITLGKQSNIRVLLAYIDGLVDTKMVNNNILKPVMAGDKDLLEEELTPHRILKILKESIITASELDEIKDFKQSVDTILSGNTIIYIDGIRIALKAGTGKWESRGVQEPDTEAVVRGPREGFTETLRTNTSLLRRKIKNPNLKFEMLTLGKQTKTDIIICYIKGLAHEELIDTVRRRLKRIKIDAVLESGYLEEFIEDAPLSIFPTVANSEKPDIVAAKILEGRVAVFCDGTPFVLTVPHLFIETFQASEDYYSRAYYSSIVRGLRLIAFILTTLSPALYVALVNFHQGVIPFKLLLTIASSREGIPFSAFTETLIMGVAFELLREAGVRMPRPIGQAISIVGALILGQAAVNAGLASNPIVIVTAVTAITSFVLPTMGGVLPIIRLAVLLAANVLGLMGMGLILVVIFVHMCTIRSFGVSYLAPFSPLYGMDLKDTFIRVPLWLMWTRPRSIPKNVENVGEEYYRMKKDIRTKED